MPSKGVVFAVTTAEGVDGSYREIRDSLRILPDGLTTVPLASTDGWTPGWGAEPEAAEALVDAVENAGLRVEIGKVGASGGEQLRGLRQPPDG